MKKELIYKDDVLQCIKESSEQIDWGQSEDEDAFKHLVGALYRTIASPDEFPVVDAIYLCNRKKCAHCSPACNFTRDIDFAAVTDKVVVVDNVPNIVNIEAGHEL